MQVEYVNPFIEAAFKVLKTEIGSDCEKGALSLVEQPLVSDDVTVLIGVAGAAKGLVLYDMKMDTALNIVSSMMMGEKVETFDAMAESALAEMGNVITGLASAGLLAQGYACNIAPPSVVKGKGTNISTLNIKRLVVPIITSVGTVTVHIALRDQ